MIGCGSLPSSTSHSSRRSGALPAVSACGSRLDAAADRRGVLAPPTAENPGSAWWRAVEEVLLQRRHARPGCAATETRRAACSTRVRLWLTFLRDPTPGGWYRAHNASIVAGYLEHRDLVAGESLLERFFMDVALVRVLYAHCLIARPPAGSRADRAARSATRRSAPPGGRPVPLAAEHPAGDLPHRGQLDRRRARRRELPRARVRLRHHRAAHRAAVPVQRRRAGRAKGAGAARQGLPGVCMAR